MRSALIIVGGFVLLPIFLLIFALPAAVGAVLWWKFQG